MRDYNYSNSNPIPNNKKVDTISIIIALIAVTLIIAGTYLLIQALKPSERAVVTNVRSSSSVSSLRSQINVVSSASTVSSENIVSSASVASQASVASSALASSAQSSVVSSASSVQSSSAPVSSAAAANSGLSAGSTSAEALFRVDSIGGGLTKLTVLRTGFTNTRWLQPGSYVNLDSSLLPNATIGSNYVIPLNIGASQTNFTIQSVGTPVRQ